ncbi:MAG: ABC transporter ATP-binding protein [Deltaproteobacteria bacterium]|jgi:peptide/nickel transport system ATP-binding protein|nr:ABC transporter ATP-binding protein [Deltaproteobacteria bacterium]
MPLLQISGLTVRYGGRTALSDFSLAMEKGEAVGLVGESGSGKTTVARSVMGLLPAGAELDPGSSIVFGGTELTGLSPAGWRRIRCERVAMIFQDSGNMLNPVRTIGSQFTEFLRVNKPFTRQEARAKAAGLLERTGLPDPSAVLASYPFQLSGGMRQRVGIAMAMAFSPELLLADEPTSALDATTQRQVIGELMSLKEREGVSIILVTHNLGVAAHVSDLMVVLKDGLVAETGAPRDIIRAPRDPYTRSLLEAVPRLA